jgi:predicted kinase
VSAVARVPVIVITGNMGSGKTTILAEASDLLTADGIVHAAVDLDTFGMGHLPDATWPALAYRNLSCVWQNYAAAGATRLLIAEAVEDRRELTRIREAVPGADIVVCRLTAALETLRRRVSQREVGVLRNVLVARVDELQVLIDRAEVEEFTIVTDDERPVTDVAREMLVRAHWLSPSR